MKADKPPEPIDASDRKTDELEAGWLILIAAEGAAPA